MDWSDSVPRAPKTVVVVLVEPAGPLNVGSVARLCANFAMAELRLVNPRCNHLGEEARLMAVHGRGLLEQARCFDQLADALADCRRVVATSGRCDGEPLPLLCPDQALDWLLGSSQSSQASQASGSSEGAPLALVFGREDRGLSNAELLQAGCLLTLGTGPAYSSLNLSHAVAVVLHSLHQKLEAPGPSALPGLDPCLREEFEALLLDAESLLMAVGFLYPHTAHARLAKVRQILQRAQISSGEVALVRGMVRQLRWASQRNGIGQTP
ncbi:RNA methyltransferase [Cyanobium sp. WAJ14-Wanaka]|uniref:RNA methyltransferase n=1 Tax=Cyanobium sp. WAJ14-Wanaka TaxID=2823725 RepID=UPI0020CFD4B1|nr:RNA methyltransferase [Cyanobium sp. WAJ14-Wanaka]MCP9774188.1 RNA methyltransferase [Cyanobium sp. WAJ14-Wanaka]